MSRARTLLVFAAAAACAVVGTMAFAFVRQNRVDVYFDNGLKAMVTISVDGESFDVTNGPPIKRALKPGPHEIVVSGQEGEIERARVEIDKKNLMSALIDPEFYVYNVAQAHIYRRASHVYAEAESQRSYSEQIYPFQQFFSQPKADFTFIPAPSTITIDSKTAKRDEFVVAADLDYNALASLRYNEGNVAEARQAVDKALQLDPCHADAFRNLFTLMTLDGKIAEAGAAASSFLASCRETGVEPHRAYQDAMTELGGRDLLLVEYRDRRDREPTAENDYLLARLLPGTEPLALYRSALDKDPAFARARLALAFDLMGLERYREAVTEIEATLDAPALLQEAASLYGPAAVGAARAQDADQKLRGLSVLHPYDAAIWQARWATTLAQSQWVEAERLLQEYQKNSGAEPLEERIQLLLLKGDMDQARRQVELAHGRTDLAPRAQVMQFDVLYTEGRYKEAADCLAEFPGGPDALHQLYAAVGLRMAGLEADATALLSALRDQLVGDGDEVIFYRAALRALTAGGSDDEALSAAREAGFLMLPHAYFLLGARSHASGRSDAASGYFRKSSETAVTLGFPYLAAKALGGT
jgi:tetratricopeptide (TPR) repeat protein